MYNSTNNREEVNKEPLSTYNVRLKKPYDSVPRSILWEAMQTLNIRYNITKAVKNLYRNNDVVIKIGNTIGITFQTTKGFLQGCLTSPTLFRILSSSLNNIGKKTTKEWELQSEMTTSTHKLCE